MLLFKNKGEVTGKKNYQPKGSPGARFYAGSRFCFSLLSYGYLFNQTFSGLQKEKSTNLSRKSESLISGLKM
jgi:hypothetical protein